MRNQDLQWKCSTRLNEILGKTTYLLDDEREAVNLEDDFLEISSIRGHEDEPDDVIDAIDTYTRCLMDLGPSI